MVPPGSVQREQHSWAPGPATRWAEGGTSQQRGAWCLLCWGGAGQGLDGRKDLPCPKGWLGSVVENQDLRPLPEPSPSLPLEGGGGGRAWGSRAFTVTHTQTQKYARLHTHTDTLVWIHPHSLIQRPALTHSCTRTDIHTCRHLNTRTGTHTMTHTHGTQAQVCIHKHTAAQMRTLTHRHPPSGTHRLLGSPQHPPPLRPNVTHTCRPLCP